MVSTVSEKGWIVIPKEIRKRYGLTKGSKVSVVDFGGAIYLFPVPENALEAARGLFKGSDGEAVLQEHLREKKEEFEKEEREMGRWSDASNVK